MTGVLDGLNERQLRLTSDALLASQVVLVPVFVVLWFNRARYAPPSAALVFIAAAITDWLDGYLARLVRASQHSSSRQRRSYVMPRHNLHNSAAVRFHPVMVPKDK